jgi:nitroimidazol reductase NimA-like FMN-containing flavoprotein (pyridoxamine 5'-phosphate oxidase superfamily)
MGDGSVLVFGRPVELKADSADRDWRVLALRTVLARHAEKIRRLGRKAARSFQRRAASCGSRADVAQLVEHSLGKGEVTGSILVISSRNEISD